MPAINEINTDTLIDYIGITAQWGEVKTEHRLYFDDLTVGGIL